MSLKELYEQYEVERYSTLSPEIKSTFVERVQQTIQNALYKAMTARQSWKWYDIIEDITKAYNDRVHSSLHGFTPNQAHLKENEEILRLHYLEDYKKHKRQFKNQRPRFQVGDTVRVRRSKKVFLRGYEAGFEKETYTIAQIVKTYPITYKLEGKRRSYYAAELARASPSEKPQDKQYFIAQTRLVKTKTLRSGKRIAGEKQYLLKAKNDSEQSSWISENEFQSLQKNGYL